MKKGTSDKAGEESARVLKVKKPRNYLQLRKHSGFRVGVDCTMILVLFSGFLKGRTEFGISAVHSAVHLIRQMESILITQSVT